LAAHKSNWLLVLRSGGLPRVEELEGSLPPRAAVPAGALALEGDAEIVGSQQVRREVLFKPCYITLLTYSKAVPN